jgi:hypothetical protein
MNPAFFRSMRLIIRFASALAALLASAAPAVDFEKDIKPILSKFCYECHSEQKNKEKAGYVFDNVTRFKKDIGVNLIIEPGNPGESHFFEVLVNRDIKHHMPPKGSLSQADLALIRTWIAEGATLDKDAPKMVAKKLLPPIMTWKNAEGATIKAGFGGVNGQSVIFKMPNGSKLEYPIKKLSAESQKLVAECAAP